MSTGFSIQISKSEMAGPRSGVKLAWRSNPVRSFRSERVSAFVRALLDGEVDDARRELAEVSARYPIVLTRSLSDARRWVRRHRRGTERAGLVASSSAQRLKPHAIDVRVDIDPVHWFLSDARDTRSSTGFYSPGPGRGWSSSFRRVRGGTGRARPRIMTEPSSICARSGFPSCDGGAVGVRRSIIQVTGFAARNRKALPKLALEGPFEGGGGYWMILELSGWTRGGWSRTG